MSESENRLAIRGLSGKAAFALTMVDFPSAGDSPEKILSVIRNARRVCEAIPQRQSSLSLSIEGAALLPGILDRLKAPVRFLERTEGSKPSSRCLCQNPEMLLHSPETNWYGPPPQALGL